MEAPRGRRGRDEVEIEDEKKTAGEDAVERWIEELRQDLEEGDRDDNKFEGLRSEANVWRVWERTKAERARGSWLERLRRSLRALASPGT